MARDDTTYEAGMEAVLDALRGIAEETRLRIVGVLGHGELTVSELTQVLAQSQPRISRHLKLLVDAGVIERRREGSWAFFRLSREGFGARVAGFVLKELSETAPPLSRDLERLDRIRERRAAAAEAYFRENASEWDRLRALHASEEAVEEAARAMLVPASGDAFGVLLDIGTGTGRMLEVFSDRYRAAVGLDLNQDMLALARSRLERAALMHADLRQGDLLALSEPEASADGAVIHQVLHFLVDPSLALGEAARVLRPGGRLLVVDFAAHEIEFLRDRHAHRRLGFSRDEIEGLGEGVGLIPLDYREIAAPADMGEDGLTVSLWLFEKAT